MTKKIFCGAAIALTIAAAPLAAQRGGGAPARPPMFPTKAQFAASAEAQMHVAAARKIAGTDLVKELNTPCSSPGRQGVARARADAGLPPLKDYTVEPVRIFDSVWFLGLA